MSKHLIVGLLVIIFALSTLNTIAQNERDSKVANCQLREERERLAGAFATTDKTFPVWLLESQQISEENSERWYSDGVLYRAWETDTQRYTVEFLEDAAINLDYTKEDDLFDTHQDIVTCLGQPDHYNLNHSPRGMIEFAYWYPSEGIVIRGGGYFKGDGFQDHMSLRAETDILYNVVYFVEAGDLPIVAEAMYTVDSPHELNDLLTDIHPWQGWPLVLPKFGD